MFEREIHKSKERLLKLLNSNHVAGSEPYTYWFEINADERIQAFYKRFFEAEVRWWVFEQQMMRAANPRFDYTHERLAYHLLNADHYAAESARFDYQDLQAATDLAVKTRFNYVIRPRTTLRWFVFRGEPTKTLQETLLRLDYFSGYDYLLNGFRAWAEQKRLSHTLTISTDGTHTDHSGTRQEIISVVEFDRVLQHVDNEHILDLSPTEFVDLTEPIFDLLLEAQPPTKAPAATPDEIPTSALVVFLDDKGIQPIARELERSIEEEDLRSLSRKGFLWVLSDIIGTLERVAASDFDEYAYELPRPQFPEQPAQAAQASDSVPLSLTFAPADEDIERNREQKNRTEQPTESRPQAASGYAEHGLANVSQPFENPIRIGNIRLPPNEDISTDGASSTVAQPSTLSDISDTRANTKPVPFYQRLSETLREELVHSVFHHSQATFEREMERLAVAASWQESATLIEELTETYRLDPNATVMQHLRDMLYQHHAR
jgi:hypothetical protein